MFDTAAAAAAAAALLTSIGASPQREACLRGGLGCPKVHLVKLRGAQAIENGTQRVQCLREKSETVEVHQQQTMQPPLAPTQTGTTLAASHNHAGLRRASRVALLEGLSHCCGVQLERS
jgi:hypothetical protein